jgi:hypothetical protein
MVPSSPNRPAAQPVRQHHQPVQRLSHTTHWPARDHGVGELALRDVEPCLFVLGDPVLFRRGPSQTSDLRLPPLNKLGALDILGFEDFPAAKHEQPECGGKTDPSDDLQ